MTEPIPLATAQSLVVGQQDNRLKNIMKRGNSDADVPRFQYKVTVLFHLKLKMVLHFVSK